MYAESSVKPELVERYATLTRINYGVETITAAINGSAQDGANEETAALQQPTQRTMYRYQMKEYGAGSMPTNADTLAEELMLDRYPLDEQVRVLSSENASLILTMNVFKQTCKDAARQIFNIPDTLKSVKERKLTEIAVYDQSDNVNAFTIEGITLWLDRNTRAALMRRFEAEKASGTDETTLWYGSSAFKMPVDTAITMLNAIEIYACKCYDATAGHKAAVNALETIDDVKGYDYKSGYPEKLSFEIDAAASGSAQDGSTDKE